MRVAAMMFAWNARNETAIAWLPSSEAKGRDPIGAVNVKDAQTQNVAPGDTSLFDVRLEEVSNQNVGECHRKAGYDDVGCPMVQQLLSCGRCYSPFPAER
jgi:hypothetical protein